MQELKIMVSGHRPNKLGGYDIDNPIRQYVWTQMGAILKYYIDEKFSILGISGMALGIDQDFGRLCVDLDLPFLAYVPFIGQENKWPEPSRKDYSILLDKAKETKIVSKGGYSPGKMQIRNKAMADDCDVAIVVWDGAEKGGTYNCYKYLKSINKKIIRIDPKRNYE